MTLSTLIRSGRVRRWHANPDLAHTGETNGHHQWVVATLILKLHPDAAPALVIEALWHDVGELGCGDLPGPFKDAHPEIAVAHAAAERRVREDLCGASWLDEEEREWLVLCDRLAAWLWMSHAAPHCAAHRDWRDARVWIEGAAERLGVSDQVSALIGGPVQVQSSRADAAVIYDESGPVAGIGA